MQYLFLQPRFASSSVMQALRRSENLRRTEEINTVLLKLWRRPAFAEATARRQDRLKVEMLGILGVDKKGISSENDLHGRSANKK